MISWLYTTGIYTQVSQAAAVLPESSVHFYNTLASQFFSKVGFRSKRAEFYPMKRGYRRGFRTLSAPEGHAPQGLGPGVPCARQALGLRLC